MIAQRRLLVGGLAAGLALAAGLYVGLGWRDAQGKVEVPPAALDRFFGQSLDDADGKPRRLADWRSGVLVVNFWATWCPPCREEMPALSRLQAKHPQAQFVGISIDSAENVKRYVKETPVGYPLLIAGTDGAELTRLLGNEVMALPYTIVIKGGREVALTKLGKISERDLDTLLAQAGR